MAETQQTLLITLPKNLTLRQRQAVANEVIEHIISRTKSGIDQFGKPFIQYSEEYKKREGKGSVVDLTLSGLMLDGLKVLSDGPGFIKLGFAAGSEQNERAAWAKTASNHVSRQFLGIQKNKLNKIINKQRVISNIILEQNAALLLGVLSGAISEQIEEDTIPGSESSGN